MSLKDRLNSQLKNTDSELVKEKLQQTLKNAESIKTEPQGLGILDTFFADSSLNSVYVSGAKNVYIEKKGVTHKSTTTFRDNVQLINLIKKNAQDAGIEYDENAPYIKFNYKKGVNVRAILPPISNVPVLFIKNYCDENADIRFLQDNQAISKELAMVLETFAGMKLNILVAGKPQTLKTTVLSTIAKLIPLTGKGISIDFKNELEINSDNFVNYDFAELKDDSLKTEILNSIFGANPDKVVVNDCDDKIFNTITKEALFGFKGLLTSINAGNIEEAIDNVAQIILKYSPSTSFEEAKKLVYKAFDIIIFVNKDKNGFRSISKISETDFVEAKINDIFYLNENNEHVSSGFVPKFYTLSNSLSINPNIFDRNYKHTYSKSSVMNFKPSDDMIKRIKENNASENSSYSSFESISKSLSSDEMLKRAQAKFEELKRNASNNNLQPEAQKQEEQIEEQPQIPENNNSEFNLNE